MALIITSFYDPCSDYGDELREYFKTPRCIFLALSFWCHCISYQNGSNMSKGYSFAVISITLL